MAQRLFQDPAGTIPAILAGQPVGLFKRIAGSVDASQATALSKATLSRHPKSGVRNLANGGFALSDAAKWLPSVVNSGVTATKIWSGLIDGIPCVRYSISGTATLNSSVTLNAAAVQMATPATVGQSRVGSTKGRIVKGLEQLLSATDGIRLDNIGRNSSGAGSAGDSTSSPRIKSENWQDLIAARTYNNAETVASSASVTFTFTSGQSYSDVQIEVQGLQIEAGLTPTALQFNYGPNDITEPGVPDLWHLYNDGGDSLNVVLPAGTYGFATLNAETKIPQIDTVASDGTTPISILRHTRQADEVLRAGAFNEAEIRAIQDYWGREFG